MQTFTPEQYLQIDIASNFGLDKETWDDRLAWFDANKDDLIEISELQGRALSSHPLMKSADEPSLFYAGICAYRDHKAGKAIAYPISLDATASGAQILAALIGCVKSARLCNVIDTGRREDLYTNIYDFMNARIGTPGQIQRTDTKAAIMTSLYGSTAQPRRVFGEDTLLEIFYETMETEAEGIWNLNRDLLDQWRDDVSEYTWTLPDNFHVVIKVMDTQAHEFKILDQFHQAVVKVNRPMENGRSLPANATHSVDGYLIREVVDRAMMSKERAAKIRTWLQAPRGTQLQTKSDHMVQTLWAHYKKSGMLSSRILGYLEPANCGLVDADVVIELIDSLPKTEFRVLTVHDCFRTHPNYGNDLRRLYNRLLHEIARSNLLEYLVTQISGNEVEVVKYGDFAAEVLDTNYALS